MSSQIADKVDMLDFSGGLNQGLPATRIERNEMADMLNFNVFGTRLRYRNGISKLSETGFSQNLTTVFPFKQSDGTWVLIVAGATAVGKMNSSNALVAISVLDRVSPYFSDARPWSFVQYKDIWYAARRNNGLLKRGTEDAMFDSGIDAPSTAATLADGGAGSLAAGSFYAVVTFYNSATDVESDPSDASTVLTLGASRYINWTAIPTSTNPQVNARRLYRTTAQPTANDPQQYYFVAQIDDNTTTTYSDDIISELLGDAVTFTQGRSPTGCFAAALWSERLWITDGSFVYPSNFGRAECYDSLDALSFNRDDGHEIRAVHGSGDRLYVGKTKGIYFVTGTSRDDWRINTLSDKQGCYSQASMKSVEGLLLWYGGDNFYRSDGGAPESISDFKVRTLLDAIPDNRKEYVSAAIYPTLSWYVVTIPNAVGFTRTLIYNYRTGAWFPWKHATPADAPNFVTAAYDTSYGQKLYGTFDGSAHAWDIIGSTYKDDGTAHDASLKTAALGDQQSTFLRVPHRVYLQSTNVVATINLLAYADGATSSTYSRTSLSINGSRAWKAYSLYPIGNLGATWQVGLEYSGGQAFDVEGLGLEFGVLKRHVGFAI